MQFEEMGNMRGKTLIPILPEGDDQYYAPGIKGVVMRLLYFGMAKWKTAGDTVTGKKETR